ncbi:epidermal growth factor receptor substrate 15-like 1 isoform X1 [Lytechinus variegatus]|uniref:epidermal growth factor receptor substrate 15-like 1 isoform X1 n=1 Tax=Lytechinus variegatus TaxID=7654 RepID=UPI001BB1C628|nr:epidermal growth factor receptor substrate 15-like 1 isoform X1 [Lytechinus variegatus]
MATFPSISQVAGPNLTAYESLFRQVDKSGTGKIGAIDAAAFLKKSGLRETILHKIWELSDPQGRGYLDKQAFVVALKLISLAQNGKEVALSGLALPAPLPNLGGTPPVHGRSGSPAMADVPWAVSAEDKAKYDGIFDGLSPIDNKLSGDKVKGVFMNSKLPVDVLSRIWDLSDIDKDGLLDRDEFSVAMYLVYRALEKDPVPAALPAKLIPPSKRKKPSLPGSVSVLPGMLPPTGGLRRVTPPPTSPALRSGSPSAMAFPQQQPSSVGAGSTGAWVVSTEEKANCDILFKQLDTEVKGYLTGDQVKQSLLETGLPHQTLAHIWNLCDIKLTGQLNSDQFALSMFLVKQAKSGIMPPPQLTPEMIPPTFRPKPGGTDSAALGDMGLISGGAPGDFSAIKELDAISKEIDTLNKEKGQLQTDIQKKEELIKMKNMEVQGLQTELDKSSAQVKQLETQKSEAQRRLDDLDQQKTKLEGLLTEVQSQCQEVQKSVDSLRGQISSQQSTVKKKKLKGEEAKKAVAKAQEEELKRAQTELITLRKEEQQLEQQVETGKSQLTTVEENLNQTNQQITELHTKLASLRETKTKLNGTMSQISQAIDTANSTGTIPQIEDFGTFNDNKFGLSHDDIFSSRATAGSSSPVSSLSGFSIGSEINSKTGDTADDKDDPFKSKDPFAGMGEITSSDPFQSEDPFKDSDPFKSEGGDPFKSDAFQANPFGGDPFKNDPFGTGATTNSEDPFGGSANNSNDPFSSSSPGSSDPFGGSTTTSKDPFVGSDPFASKSSDPFGSGSSDNKSDPFASKGSSKDSDPFTAKSTTGNDPFASKQSASSSDPFASKPAKTDDPFASNAAKSNDPFASKSATNDDPFASKSPKSDDPFSSKSANSDDPFGSKSANSNDPFGSKSAKGDDPFAGSTNASDPFAGSTNSDDPFKGNDPFASESLGGLTNGNAESKSSSDPFGSIDPFGGSAFKADSFSKSSSTDTFGSDPFSRQEDTPALPPKKSRGASSSTAKPASNSPSTTSNASDPFQAFSSDSTDPFAKVDSSSTNDPFASTGSGGKVNSSNDPFAPSGGGTDPFGGGSDPFSGGGDPFGGSASGKTDSGSDPLANFADFGGAKFEGKVLSEEDQLVWAVKEAQKEEERLKQLAIQEENDLKMALQLSQEEVGSSEA